MKKAILALTVAVIVIIACSKKSSNTNTTVNHPQPDKNFSEYAMLGLDSPFISIDSANVMLTSYQSSLSNSNDVRSFIIDADALRYYLNNTDIRFMKVMLAHKLSYIRGGNAGQPAGYSPNAMTIILAGFDKDNNYIYTPQGAVLDFAKPCPYSCPESGSASSNQLPPAQ